MRSVVRWACAATLSASVGCAHYVTPGRGADFVRNSNGSSAIIADNGIDEALSRQPLAKLPTGIAVARLQAPGYSSTTAVSYGKGRYSVVTTREAEPDAAIERLAKLPDIGGIAPISRMMLPEDLESDRELRRAAAQLHADMLLIYTLDTTFQKNDLAEPLTLITLGVSPNQKATIVTTASAVLMDTRNGYIYGTCEATSRTSKMMGAWGSGGAIDESRLKNERQAFEKLVGECEKMWLGVDQQYKRPPG